MFDRAGANLDPRGNQTAASPRASGVSEHVQVLISNTPADHFKTVIRRAPLMQDVAGAVTGTKENVQGE